jgi:glyoxylate/hydroxypyruvate reductase A
MLTILFAAPKDWPEYETALPQALEQAGIVAQIIHAPPSNAAAVDYIIYAPSSPLQDFTPFTRVKAVLSLWAGVERIVGNATLTQPLCRMVEDGLTAGMAEWVVGHVMRHHLGMDAHIVNPDHNWRPVPPPLARDRQVAMLGMGALGAACAQALAGLNFNVAGWSRTGGQVGGIAVQSGKGGLRDILAKADFIVTLLPKTPETENLLGSATLAAAKRGAVLLNPGRGALIDDDALLAALDTGQIAHATLDVFRTEPLPKDHPFWAHPRITITPHIAADTRADGAARALVDNIRRSEAGAPLLHRVDRARGY